ncbi:MAG: LysM peptidoglycan-binding domain-containing protein [Deltaproteobacteria bacterium]|nr:MAG: LysM peptidoglycan-binding domain-containing protein [Deltaproteobacteria bacterium]
MRKSFLNMVIAVLVLGLTVNLIAQMEEKLSPATQVYIVKRGDTLWDISARFLDNAWYWPRLWEQNKYITDPHMIFPGEPIALVPSPARAALPAAAVGLPAAAAAPEEGLMPTGVEELPLGEEMPAELPKEEMVVSPLVVELEKKEGTVYYSRMGSAGFISLEELAAAGLILGSKEEKLMLGEGDSVYLNLGDASGIAVGDKFTIYTVSKKVNHPVTRRTMGYKIKILGGLEVMELNGENVSTATIFRSYDVISRGNWIRPFEPSVKEIILQGTQAGLEGYIIDSQHPVSLLGEGDIVHIDRGKVDGVEAGNVFTVYRPAKKVKDQMTGRRLQIPEENVGKLVVLEPREKTSTALVTKSKKELEIGDHIRIEVF